MSEPDPYPQYRTLSFIVKYGDWLAWATVLGVLLPTLAMALINQSVFWAIGGVAGGAFLFILMRSYVELVRVIVDMLLPK